MDEDSDRRVKIDERREDCDTNATYSPMRLCMVCQTSDVLQGHLRVRLNSLDQVAVKLVCTDHPEPVAVVTVPFTCLDVKHRIKKVPVRL